MRPLGGEVLGHLSLLNGCHVVVGGMGQLAANLEEWKSLIGI